MFFHALINCHSLLKFVVKSLKGTCQEGYSPKIPLKEKKIPSQGFSINFLKNYQDTGFTEHLYVAASGQLKMAGALRYYATFNF